MGWVSPTGYNDPDNAWTNEYKAYDENLVTSSYATSLGHYLELTRPAVNCSKVRQYDIRDYGNYPVNCQIDVYYGGAWHNIYSGTPSTGVWVEFEIGSTQSVTGYRYKPISSPASSYIYAFEVDFWEVEAPPQAGRSFGFIMG